MSLGRTKPDQGVQCEEEVMGSTLREENILIKEDQMLLGFGRHVEELSKGKFSEH